MSLTPDQFRFLMANVAGLTLAIPYRLIPRTLRNEYNYVPGILMLYYCFGKQANLMLLYSAVSYAVCRFAPRSYVQRLSMCTSLAFLSYAHLSRQILDYGGYVLDISGPFMIAFQKMTSLGFCLYDGNIKKLGDMRKLKEDSDNRITNDSNNNNCDTKDEQDCNKLRYRSLNNPSSPGSLGSNTSVIGADSDMNLSSCKKMSPDRLNEEQRMLAVVETPKFNEFMGYFFHFPSVLCGPIMYYNDYSDFVNASQDSKIPPGRHKAAAKKLMISVSCACIHLTLCSKFDVHFLRSPAFLVHSSLLVKYFYLTFFTMLARLKYYVAWHLGEAISNTSGLGFNGYDTKGKPKWDLISNMNVYKFETSLNLRDAIHAWNKTTQTWLKRTAYDRAPRKLSVMATYLLSALWHGFYPGYYMTFFGGALFTHASRNGRRIIRPIFQRGRLLPMVYDGLTFILTRLTIAYVAFPFVILDFQNNFEIYKSLYFSIHVLGVFGVLLGYFCRRK